MTSIIACSIVMVLTFFSMGRIYCDRADVYCMKFDPQTLGAGLQPPQWARSGQNFPAYPRPPTAHTPATAVGGSGVPLVGVGYEPSEWGREHREREAARRRQEERDPAMAANVAHRNQRRNSNQKDKDRQQREAYQAKQAGEQPAPTGYTDTGAAGGGPGSFLPGPMLGHKTIPVPPVSGLGVLVPQLGLNERAPGGTTGGGLGPFIPHLGLNERTTAASAGSESELLTAEGCLEDSPSEIARRQKQL